ncbi:atypical chemokine receptor 4 [Protopterus annectens]|uniref:atypical chemokine receptor 4 n=1 Tax=Protopterus annectens TaxID=7888 RepID=UPI001CFB87EB|nr:atypical chemokine receptor 4 [Protopterus annectens]
MESEGQYLEDYDYYGNYTNETYNYDYYPLLCMKHEVRNFGKWFLPAFYSVALVTGLAGNSLVVAIYIIFKKLKTKTDVYLMHLAIADLLLLFTLSFWVVDALHGWVFGTVMCKITSALYVTNFSCGMLFLACICVDQYIAIKKAASALTPTSKSTVICLCVWLTAILLSIPDLVFTTVREKDERSICLSIFPDKNAKEVKATIQILQVIFAFLIPFFFMSVCYSAVAKVIINTTNKKKYKAFKLLLTVMGVFILTQLPYNTVKLYRTLNLLFSVQVNCDTEKRIDIATQVTESIALFHSCLNPVLYAFMGASFKTHILMIIKSYSHQRRQNDLEISLDSQPHSEETNSFVI